MYCQRLAVLEQRVAAQAKEIEEIRAEHKTPREPAPGSVSPPPVPHTIVMKRPGTKPKDSSSPRHWPPETAGEAGTKVLCDGSKNCQKPTKVICSGSKERYSQKPRVADSGLKANEGPPKTNHDQPFKAERPKAGQRKEQRSTLHAGCCSGEKGG
jgi:hypothetical protein